MLQAMLLAGLVAAPLGSLALFVPVRRRGSRPGSWSAIRRFILAVFGTIVLAAAVVVTLRLLGASQHNLIAGVAGVVFASLAWMPVTRRWSARAHVCWASTVFLFVVFLIYALEWTFSSNLGLGSTAGGVLLWVLELFAAVLSCAYLWEICDALGTEHWRRRITPTTPLRVSDRELPMVSLHVPAHNEPPEMVIDTLRSLLRIDYPRYEIILIDDNTDDESLWRPVEEWCARHGVTFAHAEVIGIVDSDYQVDPGWLRRCAAAFADPWVGFVQSPQDYRNEPPEMVIATLTSLLKLDYPRYQIVAIDDNTEDEAQWRPVEHWCDEHGVTFAHLTDWPGYKSGALNYALGELTDPGAGVIGVVDSDYQIEPGFLRRCAPAFADPWIGFVQAPQDYRGWQQAAY